ncbi:MAG: hypothetical protein NTZ05_19060 [Chloroflexi bacterium]|nr:hypothetical protein [Chloroflexota bacterium]
MGTTQANLLAGFGKQVGDYFASVTTSAGSVGGTTLVDTALTPAPDSALRGRSVRLPGTTAEADKNRLITASTQSSGTLTVTPGFAAQVGSGVAYQVHRYDPALKLQALNDARAAAFPGLFVQTEDTSLTVAAGQYAYALPAGTVEVRQVWLQQNASVADYPYEPLSAPRDWELADSGGTRTLRLSAAAATRGVGLKLRLVSVKPLSAVAVDTDSMEAQDADDLRLLYLTAAALLFDRLRALGPAQETAYYQEEQRRWSAETAQAMRTRRKRWPPLVRVARSA